MGRSPGATAAAGTGNNAGPAAAVRLRPAAAPGLTPGARQPGFFSTITQFFSLSVAAPPGPLTVSVTV